MSHRTRTRIVLIALSLMVPLAAAQSLPGPMGGLPLTETPSKEIAPPAAPPREARDLEEVGFIFRGSPDDPSYIKVMLPDGTPALEYVREDSGRSRLDVAGTTALPDATLLRVEGDARSDNYTLVLLDPAGEEHSARIDHGILRENLKWPNDTPMPVVELLRPPSWPGAPKATYLLYIEDSEPNHLAATALDGKHFLQNRGTHRVALQLPIADADFDRIILRASHGNASQNAVFQLTRETATAAVYQAGFLVSALTLADGDTVEIQPFYERRMSPFVVERFPEQGNYSYRVDATGPTITLQAPARADNFSFGLTWSGSDARSGMGGFTIDYREAGQSTYVRWITKGNAHGATFSGDWGRTYEFRATALDAVGNPSGHALGKTTVDARPAGVDDINDPPVARIITPQAGSVLAGVLNVVWQGDDPDGTPVTSKLEVSPDDGVTWRVLYSGPGTQTTWDTTSDADGPGYRLRLSVTDGAQQAGDAAPALTVRNIMSSIIPANAGGSSSAPLSQPSPAAVAHDPASTDAQAEAGASAAAPAKKPVPAPIVGVTVFAFAAAALLARRRRG